MLTLAYVQQTDQMRDSCFVFQTTMKVQRQSCLCTSTKAWPQPHPAQVQREEPAQNTSKLTFTKIKISTSSLELKI